MGAIPSCEYDGQGKSWADESRAVEEVFSCDNGAWCGATGNLDDLSDSDDRTPTHDEKVRDDVFKIIPDHRESCVAINGPVSDVTPRRSVCHRREPPPAVENQVTDKCQQPFEGLGTTRSEVESTIAPSSDPGKLSPTVSSEEAFTPVRIELAVPEGVGHQGAVSFVGPDGEDFTAWVPQGAHVGETFEVQVRGTEVFQPCTVVVPKTKGPGDKVTFVGPDGRHQTVTVPDATFSGDKFVAWLRAAAPPELLESEELEPWLKAASNFTLNDDFEGSIPEKHLGFLSLLSALRRNGVGRRTAQLLTDKLLMSRVIDNLDVPQMPTLLAIEELETMPSRVRSFADANTHCVKRGRDLVVRPTHLSDVIGVSCLSVSYTRNPDACAKHLQSHMTEFMCQRVSADTDPLLATTRPGFLIHPKYDIVEGGFAPLELRILTLWGKARVGIWRSSGQPNALPRHTTWLTRCLAKRGELNDEDDWEVVHESPDNGPDFLSAKRALRQHMRSMAATAELLSTSLGVPFLRVDFFVGSCEWGTRLNKVAGITGSEYRRPLKGTDGAQLVDDGPAMVQILQEGLRACTKRSAAGAMLAKLGVEGDRYEQLSVRTLPRDERSHRKSHAVLARQGDAGDAGVLPRAVTAMEMKLHHISDYV